MEMNWTLKLKNQTIGMDRTLTFVPLTNWDDLATLRSRQDAMDAVEVRADHLMSNDAPDAFLAALTELRSQLDLPILLTLRSKPEGGQFQGTQEALNALYTQAIQQNLCDAIDVELKRFPPQLLQDLRALCQERSILMIGSHHDFGMAYEFTEIKTSLIALKQLGCDIPKLAVKAFHVRDSLHVIQGAYEAAVLLRQGVIAMAMGEAGQLSRLAGHRYGIVAQYAALADEHGSAPGQFTVDQLQTLRSKL